MASRTSTHITFSWDINIVDDYHSSSYIDFYLYYQQRSYIRSLYIYYSSATRNGTTFSYTSPLETFNNGPYIMWVQVYLYYLYHSLIKSERKYVDIGKSDLARNTLTIGTSVIYIFPKALHFNTVHVL